MVKKVEEVRVTADSGAPEAYFLESRC